MSAAGAGLGDSMPCREEVALPSSLFVEVISSTKETVGEEVLLTVCDRRTVW